MMDALRFRNIIASLFNIDRGELANAGVIDFGTVGDADWRALQDSPARFVLSLDDDRLAALWSLVKARQRQDPLVEALRLYDEALREAEAILGGEYDLTDGPLFDKIQAARELMVEAA